MRSLSWLLPILCLVLAASLFAFDASRHVPVQAWWSVWQGGAPRSMDEIILVYATLPRAGVALVAGAALGLAGALLQILLRNPLADPSTLGISSGAQLAIVVATLFFPGFLDGHRGLVALIGAAAATALVFALGWRRGLDPVTMVVSGLLIGVTCSAIAAALTLAQGEYLMSLVTWNGGSLSQQGWSTVLTLGAECVVFAVLSAFLVRPIVVFSLGDAGAHSLGVNLAFVRLAAAAVAAALAGCVAAAVGMVGFVGLAAPAITRALGARRPAAVLLGAPCVGALMLWLCDGLVQLLALTSGESFPTGSVTALIGGPLLLWLLPRVKSGPPASSAPTAPVRRRRLPALAPALPAILLMVFVAFFVARDGTGWIMLDLPQARDLLPLRWPRLVASGAAGGLLAMTGAILQRMTGNAMASPEVIGVSGGAGLGYALALTFAPAAGSLVLLTGAGSGALVVMLLVLAFAKARHLPPDKLLLAGIAVSALSSSVLAALMAVGDQRAWQILAWLGGSAAMATSQSAVILLCLALGFAVIATGFSRWLTLLPLGPPVAQALGLSMGSVRAVLLVACGIATGASSLLVGPLSFVGLIAPHIALRAGFSRSADHMLASFVIGALLMLLADFGARMATFPYELPLGLFAALVGAPYLIWLIGRR